ncbi:MAG TPA: hypothetical protein VIR63_06290 [Pontiella sp.]
MKYILSIALITVCITSIGCSNNESRKNEKEVNPTFMFGCFRKEIVSSDYHIPNMNSARVANYLQNKIKTLPGYLDSSYDISTRMLTVEYKSSNVRMMNFEEAIAFAGFSVNNRPANPQAKVPSGVK